MGLRFQLRLPSFAGLISRIGQMQLDFIFRVGILSVKCRPTLSHIRHTAAVYSCQSFEHSPGP